MSVRAKFKVTGIKRSQSSKAPRGEDGKYDYTKSYPVEMQTIELSPVYGNGDPNHENTKFWEASPSGKIELGTINETAWKEFELGQEYYVDFTKAEN